MGSAVGHTMASILHFTPMSSRLPFCSISEKRENILSVYCMPLNMLTSPQSLLEARRFVLPWYSQMDSWTLPIWETAVFVSSVAHIVSSQQRHLSERLLSSAFRWCFLRP